MSSNFYFTYEEEAGGPHSEEIPFSIAAFTQPLKVEA